MIVYKITNTVNGDSYIGQTVKTTGYRWIQHVSSAAKGSTFYLHNAIRKYGPDAFVPEIICECQNKEEMDAIETFSILAFNTKYPNGYNMTDGGDGVTGPRLRPSKPRPPVSDEHRKKIGDAHRGRRLPLEQRQKMSASRMGLKRGPFTASHRQKIGDGNRGKIVSLEARQKMSLSRTGRVVSEETKAKIARAHAGKKFSEEHKKKLSEARKGKVPWNKGMKKVEA